MFNSKITLSYFLSRLKLYFNITTQIILYKVSKYKFYTFQIMLFRIGRGQLLYFTSQTNKKYFLRASGTYNFISGQCSLKKCVTKLNKTP